MRLPTFLYSTFDFVARLWSRLLPRHESEPEPITPARIKRSYRRKVDDGSPHLVDLLDGIEKTFQSLSVGALAGSYTHHDLRTGLKRMGPHVPLYDIDTAWDPGHHFISNPTTTELSSLIFVAPNWHRRGLSPADPRKGNLPDLLYAQRLKKSPWYVEKTANVVYEAGAAYMTHGRYDWYAFHVSVNEKTGEVSALKQLTNQPVSVGKVSYNRRVWDYNLSDIVGNSKRKQDLLIGAFLVSWDFWQQRSKGWSVSFRKDKARVTFVISPQHAKSYFRDRARTALTAAGKLRPIIHLVTEHQREYVFGKVTTVREHIRGLRTFVWRGFICAVTAPKFHTWNTSAFTIGAVDEKDFKGQSHPISAVGAMLARAEDEQVLRYRKPVRKTRMKNRPRRGGYEARP